MDSSCKRHELLSYTRTICHFSNMDEEDPAHPLEYLIAAVIVGGSLIYGVFSSIAVLVNVLND